MQESEESRELGREGDKSVKRKERDKETKGTYLRGEAVRVGASVCVGAVLRVPCGGP